MNIAKKRDFAPHTGRSRNVDGTFKRGDTTVEKLIRDGELMENAAKVVIRIDKAGDVSVEKTPFSFANYLCVLKETTKEGRTFYAVACEIGLGRSVPYRQFEIRTAGKVVTFRGRKQAAKLSTKETLKVWPVVLAELKDYVDGLAIKPRKGRLEWALDRNVSVRHPFFITTSEKDELLSVGFMALAEHYRKLRNFQVLALRLLSRLEYFKGWERPMEVLAQANYTPESVMQVLSNNPAFLTRAKRIIETFARRERGALNPTVFEPYAHEVAKMLQAASSVGLELTLNFRMKRTRTEHVERRHRKAGLLVGLYPSEEAITKCLIQQSAERAKESAPPEDADADIPF